LVQLVVLFDEELQQASEKVVFDGVQELLLMPSLQVPVWLACWLQGQQVFWQVLLLVYEQEPSLLVLRLLL
jgi:hypothetical protein